MTTAIASGTATISSSEKAIDDEDFGFTASQLGVARRAVITARTNGVMMLYVAGLPLSATVGHHIPTTGITEVLGNVNINALRFLRDADADAVVTITLEA